MNNDENISLELEPLFICRDKIRKNRIVRLNMQGIFTVADFINTKFDSLINTPEILKEYKVFQQIFLYKYRGIPLTIDVLLDCEYSFDISKDYKKFSSDLYKLGFDDWAMHKYYLRLISNSECRKMRMIDIIRIFRSNFEFARPLIDFYIKYYESNFVIRSADSTERKIAALESEKARLLDDVSKIDDLLGYYVKGHKK